MHKYFMVCNASVPNLPVFKGVGVPLWLGGLCFCWSVITNFLHVNKHTPYIGEKVPIMLRSILSLHPVFRLLLNMIMSEPVQRLSLETLWYLQSLDRLTRASMSRFCLNPSTHICLSYFLTKLHSELWVKWKGNTAIFTKRNSELFWMIFLAQGTL